MEVSTELFDKYLGGEMSEEEKRLFEKSLQEDVDLKKHFVAYKEILEIGGVYFDDSTENILSVWKKELPKEENWGGEENFNLQSVLPNPLICVFRDNITEEKQSKKFEKFIKYLREKEDLGLVAFKDDEYDEFSEEDFHEQTASYNERSLKKELGWTGFFQKILKQKKFSIDQVKKLPTSNQYILKQFDINSKVQASFLQNIMERMPLDWTHLSYKVVLWLIFFIPIWTLVFIVTFTTMGMMKVGYDNLSFEESWITRVDELTFLMADNDIKGIGEMLMMEMIISLFLGAFIFMFFRFLYNKYKESKVKKFYANEDTERSFMEQYKDRLGFYPNFTLVKSHSNFAHAYKVNKEPFVAIPELWIKKGLSDKTLFVLQHEYYHILSGHRGLPYQIRYGMILLISIYLLFYISTYSPVSYDRFSSLSEETYGVYLQSFSTIFFAVFAYFSLVIMNRMSEYRADLFAYLSTGDENYTSFFQKKKKGLFNFYYPSSKQRISYLKNPVKKELSLWYVLALGTIVLTLFRFFIPPVYSLDYQNTIQMCFVGLIYLNHVSGLQGVLRENKSFFRQFGIWVLATIILFPLTSFLFHIDWYLENDEAAIFLLQRFGVVVGAVIPLIFIVNKMKVYRKAINWTFIFLCILGGVLGYEHYVLWLYISVVVGVISALVLSTNN